MNRHLNKAIISDLRFGMKNYISLLVIFAVIAAGAAGEFLLIFFNYLVNVNVNRGPVNFWFLDCVNKVW